MKSRISPFLTASALGIGALLVYAPFLQRAPIYLAHDEVVFALNAHSIASTGRDLTGRYLPLYVGHFWSTPINIYLTALFLKLAPVSEAVIRLPSVVVGVVDVVLLYFLGRQIFKRELLAVVAAVLLALTPAHFIHSRLGVDHLYPVAFVIAWLLCLVIFLERKQLWVLFVGTICLAVGFYSYLAAVVMMPVYFLLTCFTLALSDRKSYRPYLVAAIGFIVPLLPLIPWHLTHPAQYAQQVSAYALYDAARVNPLRGLLSLLSYPSISLRSGVYYNFFNPSLLFLTGDSSVINSTRQAGVFLWPVAVLLPLGIYQVVNVRRTRTNAILMCGLALSPLAGVLVGEVMINRALVMLPFAVLIATFGLELLLSAGRKLWRVAGVCLLVAMPVQFGVFYLDYLTDYRVRSSRWFERNIRGALEEIMARDGQEPVPAVYLSRDIVWIDFYWRLYLIKYHREDLLGRTVYFDPKTEDVQAMPWRSLLLMNFDQARNESLVTTGKLLDVKLILEPDDAPSFSLFARN